MGRTKGAVNTRMAGAVNVCGRSAQLALRLATSRGGFPHSTRHLPWL